MPFGRKPCLMRYVSLLVMACASMILISCQSDDSVAGCPTRLCHCHDETADCSHHHKHLQYIPKVPSRTKCLIFSGNWLANITQESLKNVSHLNLTALVLGTNNIRFIAKEAFELFPQLNFLDLSGNHLDVDILRQSFYGLRNSNLRKLYLINMSLSEIKDDFFQYLRSTPLTGIALASNRLTSLNGSAFKHIPKLIDVEANSNILNRLVLDGLENLKGLRLRRNKFERVPDFCHEDNGSAVPNLEILDLGNNKITGISPYQFNGQCLPSVRNLTMDGNPFEKVPDNAFSDLPKLTRLSLTYLQGQDILFEQYAFNSSNLKLLYIGNHITNFVQNPHFPYLFRHCTNLELLDMSMIRLSTSNIGQIQSMLSPLTKLRKLTLPSTYLFQIPSDLFHTMPNLTSLNLQHSQITGWPESTFHNVSSLKYLRLSYNRIAVINKTSFPMELLDRLALLDLHTNEFSCNCDAYWFRQWMKTNMKKLAMAKFQTRYQCKSPASWIGKELVEYDPSYRDCHPISPYLIYGLSAGTGLLVILVIGALVYRYRWHIRHYIYLMRARRGYERLPEGEEFVYDAFVAYSSDDRVWIISQLIPQMEQNQHCHLCLHERDFKPGKLIVDNIQETISRSRKVILVLSNSFVKSHWCKLEMTMAQLRHVDDEESPFVIIMLEDIRPEHMSNFLHNLLKTTTYIPWTEDEMGRNVFWEKLTNAIKTRRN